MNQPNNHSILNSFDVIDPPNCKNHELASRYFRPFEILLALSAW